MKARIIFATVLLCLAVTFAVAQQPVAAPHPGPQPGPDPFGGSLFPPELVIQNQQAIGLSDEQKAYLRTEIRDAQVKFTDLQWKLQDEMEKMVSLVKQPRVDEQQVLAQLDKVLTAEREIKRAQVALLVHIKNKLTPDQQAKLDDIRAKFQH